MIKRALNTSKVYRKASVETRAAVRARPVRREKKTTLTFRSRFFAVFSVNCQIQQTVFLLVNCVTYFDNNNKSV